MALQTPAPGSTAAKAKLDLELFPGAFDMNRMDALLKRGEEEAVMMQAVTGPPLLAPVLLPIPETVAAPVPSRASAGFGVVAKKGSKNKASQKKKKTAPVPEPVPVPVQQEQDPLLALSVNTLQQDGVVRLNNVLSSATAATLRKEVLARRDASYEAVRTGDDWRKHFADVLLKGSDSTRCDLLLPLTGNRAVQIALKELLLDDPGVGKVSLGNMLETAIGDDATLYELSVLISEPGSGRQPVHPDNPYQEHMPLTTCFVALQDITANMGPTTFIPGSNTETTHAAFDTSVATRDVMLQQRPNTFALLQAGDASLFDSRTLHCAGANDLRQGSTRAVMCISFRNPRATEAIGNVGSIMPDIKPFTLNELRQKLAMISEDDPTMDPFDDDDDEDKDVETKTIGAFRIAAAKGDVDAMFNLGLCYKNGEQGVETDAATAFSWFQRAATAEIGGDGQHGHATAQCNLAACYYTGEGVSQNDVEAVRWFELAAAQGLAAAQHNLGFCYATGTGVTLDNAKAAVLFQQAAAQGHPGAQDFFEEVTKQ
jgi:ectoine hydroxylase-related dioxygenase (phytanoyl-CoA dioxygenase family)